MIIADGYRRPNLFCHIRVSQAQVLFIVLFSLWKSFEPPIWVIIGYTAFNIADYVLSKVSFDLDRILNCFAGS